MKTHYAAFLSLLISPALALVACRGQALDVGSTDTSDAAPPIDGSSTQPPIDTGAEARYGLFIDGLACPSVVEIGGDGASWPGWRIALQGPCQPFGDVYGYIESRADLAYPQSCSVATTFGFTIPPLSDAGTTDFVADSARGSCTIWAGPSLATPSAALAFDATLELYFDATRIHRLTYRRRPSGGPGDASVIDSGGGELACNLQPTGHRPAAVQCAATGANDACTKDSDCATGSCGCARATDGHNVCLSNSNCRVDADCASGQRCAPSDPFMLGYPPAMGGIPVVNGNEITPENNSFEEALGYFCTSPEDTCCPSDAGSYTCVYDWKKKRFSAGYAP